MIFDFVSSIFFSLNLGKNPPTTICLGEEALVDWLKLALIA